MLKVIGCITEEHDLRLVVVAGLICLFASFTAFNLMDRATITQRTRYVWLATAALVTGSGVWATHFVAMLAFKPGIPVGYDIDLTALSILIAVVISGVGFLVSLDWRQHALGGMIVALAVGTMHFVGMAALDVAAQKNWDYSYVAASMVVGLTFAAAALVVFQRGRDLSFRLASSGLLTVGICGMHFVAMTALSFTPDPLIEIPTHAIQSEWLGIGVIGVALLIVGTGLVGSVVDRRLAQRAEIEAGRLRQHLDELAITTKALRESEERIRGIAESLHGFLFQCAVEPGESIRFNAIGSARFPLDSAKPDSPLDFVMQEDRGNLTSTILAAHKAKSGWERTIRVLGSDGSWRSVRATARLSNKRNSDVWDGIALDETERLAAEAHNAELQAKLRQAEKMEALGTLAGGVAHELNNLLQPILMMTELVVMKLPSNSEHVDRLRLVIDGATKAGEIVQRILSFGRVEEAAIGVLDISTVTRDAVSFVRTILPSCITLHTDIEDLCGNVRGDKTQLSQVVINLATNARDAIGSKTGSVWMSLSNVTVADRTSPPLAGTLKNGRYALLSVRDSGCGMDARTVKRIFEPFFTTKQVGKGTGLGLSVTHGIIAAHGGAIDVTSDPGSGTTFSIYLPVEEPTATLAMAG